MGAGIDYSLGTANVDRKTGIHYGVISQNEVLQAWADSSEPYYGEIDEDTETGEQDYAEPISFTYDDEGYIAECGEDGDIFILKAPYYTLCAFCSPCAPGAGYIMDTREDGIKTYCFGHDWFDSGKAPYPVYSVKTGEKVEATGARNHGEDRGDRMTKTRCKSCEVVYINGVRCHEHGCPDEWRDTKRKCSWCGTVFTPEDRRQSYCSEDCYATDHGLLFQDGEEP